ncbi:hypothetical protein APSETT445_003871 [Aspergillus pseudonomiae]
MERPRIPTAPEEARPAKDLSTASSSPIPVEKAPLNQIEKVECERKMAGTSKVEASEAVAALKRQVPEKLPRMTILRERQENRDYKGLLWNPGNICHEVIPTPGISEMYLNTTPNYEHID